MRSSSLLAGLAAALAFGVLALAADAWTTRAIARSEWLQAAKVGRVIKGVDERDIPVFGASKAVADYIPAVLGPAVYNYGLAGTSHDVTNLLLTFETRERSRAPIIVDVHQGAVPEIGDVRDYIPFAHHPEVEAFLRAKGQWRWYYKVPGLRYFGSYDWYLRGLVADLTARPGSVVRGYLPPVGIAAWDGAGFDTKVERRLARPFAMGVPDAEWQALTRIVARTPHRRFVLVLSPLHRSYFANATGQDRFERQLAAMRRFPHVTVLDFTHADYPDAYFRDTSHLNERGAAVFSRELRAALPAEARR